MADILTQGAPCATPPRPHPVIDAIASAGERATVGRTGCLASSLLLLAGRGAVPGAAEPGEGHAA